MRKEAFSLFSFPVGVLAGHRVLHLTGPCGVSQHVRVSSSPPCLFASELCLVPQRLGGRGVAQLETEAGGIKYAHGERVAVKRNVSVRGDDTDAGPAEGVRVGGYIPTVGESASCSEMPCLKRGLGN